MEDAGLNKCIFGKNVLHFEGEVNLTANNTPVYRIYFGYLANKVSEMFDAGCVVFGKPQNRFYDSVFKGYQMEDIFVHLSLINDPMHLSVFPFSFVKIRAIHDASPGSDCLPPATL